MLCVALIRSERICHAHRPELDSEMRQRGVAQALLSGILLHDGIPGGSLWRLRGAGRLCCGCNHRGRGAPRGTNVAEHQSVGNCVCCPVLVLDWNHNVPWLSCRALGVLLDFLLGDLGHKVSGVLAGVGSAFDAQGGADRVVRRPRPHSDLRVRFCGHRPQLQAPNHQELVVLPSSRRRWFVDADEPAADPRGEAGNPISARPAPAPGRGNVSRNEHKRKPSEAGALAGGEKEAYFIVTSQMSN
mmetsp:Transcript_12065/g.33415  ORF Transcript_12065/g.33415 Transcript_12065/m.33415 type:complete len:244 (+) Transcript_12065:1322-2053(+)